MSAKGCKASGLMDTRRRVRSLSARSFKVRHDVGGPGYKAGMESRLPRLCACCQLQGNVVTNLYLKRDGLGQTRLKLIETFSTLYVRIEECLSVSCGHHTGGEVWRRRGEVCVPFECFNDIDAWCIVWVLPAMIYQLSDKYLVEA